MAVNLPWLEEVKADAERLTLKRIRDQKETAAYEAEKLTPRVEAPAEEVKEEKKGK